MFPKARTPDKDANMPLQQHPRFDAPLADCPMCGSTSLAEHDHDFQGITIVRCRNCRLLFMNPQYSDSYLADFYAHYVATEVADSLETRQRVASKTDDLGLLQRFVRPGRLLSIGCGDGLELELAHQQGWQVEGFDVDPITTAHVARRVRARIHTGDFFYLGLPNQCYDCVIMDQVLEHPKNPQAYLVEIHRLLKPLGVLFIGCPNIHSVSNSIKTILGRLGLKRRRGTHYGTFHHLFYYSPRTLPSILQHYYGYQVLAVEGTPHAGRQSRLATNAVWRQLSIGLRRKFPWLDSTFRVVCRKAGMAVVAPRELSVARAWRKAA